MKIFKKLLAVFCALILVLALFIQFAVPKIAASYVEKHSAEWIGRQVKINDFHWSLLSFEIHLNGVTLFEQDNQTEFVGWDNFSLDISPLALLTGTGKLESFKLNGLRANVIQNGEHFNFSDILDFLNKQNQDSLSIAQKEKTNVIENQKPIADSLKTAKDSIHKFQAKFVNPLKSLPIKVQLENIDIKNVSLSYKDIATKRELIVEKISVSIPEISSKNPDAKVLVHAEFPLGGKFDLTTNVNLDSGLFKVNTNLNEYNLENAFSIARSIVQIDSLKGNFSLKINADGSISDPLSTIVSGTVKMKDVQLKESAGGAYELNYLGTGFTGVSIAQNKIPVDSLIVNGVNAHFDLFKNTNNIAKLLKQEPKEESKDSTIQAIPKELAKNTEDSVSLKTTPDTTFAEKPKTKEKLPEITLKTLDISNVKFTLNDYSIKKPMHYTVRDIQVSGKDISMKSLGIKVSMHFPQSGTLNLDFKGSPSDLTTMKINLLISQMALQPFSPYSIHFTGFPLKAGTLNVESHTNVVKNELDSKNSVLIHKIDVEDKVKNIEPEFSIPMKVGLYLLKDRKDDIKIDLPVKGNISDPEFSFGKIIWKTFCNLIVKVALTPTKLLTAPVDALTSEDSKEKANTSED
jgi:hypothetical protein